MSVARLFNQKGIAPLIIVAVAAVAAAVAGVTVTQVQHQQRQQALQVQNASCQSAATYSACAAACFDLQDAEACNKLYDFNIKEQQQTCRDLPNCVCSTSIESGRSVISERPQCYITSTNPLDTTKYIKCSSYETCRQAIINIYKQTCASSGQLCGEACYYGDVPSCVKGCELMTIDKAACDWAGLRFGTQASPSPIPSRTQPPVGSGPAATQTPSRTQPPAGDGAAAPGRTPIAPVGGPNSQGACIGYNCSGFDWCFDGHTRPPTQAQYCWLGQRDEGCVHHPEYHVCQEPDFVAPRCWNKSNPNSCWRGTVLDGCKIAGFETQPACLIANASNQPSSQPTETPQDSGTHATPTPDSNQPTSTPRPSGQMTNPTPTPSSMQDSTPTPPTATQQPNTSGFKDPNAADIGQWVCDFANNCGYLTQVDMVVAGEGGHWQACPYPDDLIYNGCFTQTGQYKISQAPHGRTHSTTTTTQSRQTQTITPPKRSCGFLGILCWFRKN